MLRKIIVRCCLAGLALVMLFVGAVVVTCALATTTPAVYAEAVKIDDIEQGKRRFEQTLVRLAGVFLTPDQRAQLRHEREAQDLFSPAEWTTLIKELDRGIKHTTQTISQDDLNAWIAHEYPKLPGDDLQDPRILFEEGRMTLAARTQVNGFSFVWGAELTPIVTPDRLELEIHQLRIGYLPLPVERIAHLLADANAVSQEGISLNVDTSPPRLCLNWKDDDLRIRIVDATIVDHQMELTVEAVEPPDNNGKAVARK